MNSYSKIVSYFQKKAIPLSDYTEYLAFCLQSPFIQISESLTKRNIVLADYLNYLENMSSSNHNAEKYIENIGQILLTEKRMTLQEINAVLQGIPLDPQKFLQQLIRLHKISLEEFFIFSQQNHSTLPNSPYRLKTENATTFYLDTLKNQKKYGSYAVLGELGRGGMGIVYKAYHEKLNRMVALKILLAGKNSNERTRQRFLREIEMMAQLQHKGIVQIYDSGEQEEELYLAMEYVDGKPLNQMREEIPLQEKIYIIQQVLEALYDAHQKGIIHRDIKLENILITTGGFPKIADFGLAKKIEDEEFTKLTKSGAILGTLHYMAPEQARGEINSLDARTDIYAVGVCLYYLLTARFPHEGTTQQQLLNRIIHNEPTPPSKYVSLLRHDLEAILLKALEKEKTLRYLTAQHFAEDLERFLNGVPVEAIKMPTKIKIQKWIRRYHQSLFLTLLLFLASFFGIGSQLWFSKQEKTLLFQKKYQKVLEQIQHSPKTFEEATYLYLSIWNNLNEALQVLNNNKKAEQQKWEIGEKLLKISLHQETHYLGDYVLQEMQQLNTISTQVREKRKQLWIFQKKQKLQQEEQQFQYWITHLHTGKFSKEQGEEALYQIVKMSLPSISQKLIEILQEGNNFFAHSEKYTSPELIKAHYYIWIAELIGKRKIKEAHPFVRQGLSSLVSRGSQEIDARLRVQKTHYTVALSKYFLAINDFSQADFLQNLRYLSGQNSLFWKSTEWIIQKLYQKKLASETLSKTSNLAKDYLARAHQNYYSKNFKTSIELLTLVLQLDPNSSEAYNQRALAKREIQDIQGAIEDCNQAIRIDPTRQEFYNSRGNAKRDQLDYAGAIADFSQAIRLNPHAAEAYNNRGNVKLDQQDIQGAIEDFTQAIQINPQSIDAYNNRGHAKKAKKDFRGAILDYNKAIELYPESVDAYNGRGIVKKNIGDIDSAIADFTEAIRINPQYREAYTNRGNAKTEKKDYDGAIADYSEAIRLYPRDRDAHYNRGNAKQHKRDLEGAIADYNEAIRIDPQDFDIYFNRGMAKLGNKNLEEAILDFTKVIQLRPTDVESYFCRGEAKRERNDFDGAIADYNATIQLDPQYFSAYFNRGLLYLRVKKNPIQAKKDFQQFIQLTQTENNTSQVTQSLALIYQYFPELKAR